MVLPVWGSAFCILLLRSNSTEDCFRAAHTAHRAAATLYLPTDQWAHAVRTYPPFPLNKKETKRVRITVGGDKLDDAILQFIKKEYNLALGERRAQSTKLFLADLGVSPARLTIVSYGEEQPADPEADATVTLTRAFWIKLVTKQASIRDLIFSDDLDVEGDRLKLVSFFSLLDDPNEAFPIVTP